MQLRIVAEAAAVRRARLVQQQQPVASLLAGLAMMSRRPPLLALAGGEGGNDDFVKVRVLLDSTLPVIRRRTAALSAELAEGDRLERAALAARRSWCAAATQLAARRVAICCARAPGTRRGDRRGRTGAGQRRRRDRIGRGCRAIARRRGKQPLRLGAGVRARGERSGPAPAGAARARAMPRPIRLPASGGQRGYRGARRGQRERRPLARPDACDSRGVAVAVPASGIVRFSGPYRSHDGIVIIDHGRGWLSLIVNVATPLKAGRQGAHRRAARPRPGPDRRGTVPKWAPDLACPHRRFIWNPVKCRQRRLNACPAQTGRMT